MTSVAITQPTYLPWLGYFEQMARADIFVFLDTVQFTRQSWQSRNRIRDRDGRLMWLSVPVAAHHLDDRICEIRIADQKSNWQRKHLNSVRTYLGRTPHIEQVLDTLQTGFDLQHERLADLNISLIQQTSKALGLTPRFLRASELSASGQRADLLMAICKELDCDQYLANAGSRAYLSQEEARFHAEGIAIAYQQWEHPKYPQRGSGFVPNLSWVDPVSYLGWHGSLRTETHGRL